MMNPTCLQQATVDKLSAKGFRTDKIIEGDSEDTVSVLMSKKVGFSNF